MTQINPVQMAFASWQASEELARQREIVDARIYYEGAQLIQTTDRIRALLGLSAGAEVKLKLNIIRTVVTAITERMAVKKVGAIAMTPVAGDDEAASAATMKLAAWADRTWALNALDVIQDEVYTDAVNEGEGFIVVDWDDTGKRVRMLPHPRYTDTMARPTTRADGDVLRAGSGYGDGFGVKLFHENGDPNQPVIRASKRWREEMQNGQARLRLTEYYPGRIEKYIVNGAGVMPHQDDGDATWPLPWVDANGQPLGVPVFAATNPDRRPEALDAWPIQDAVNQALLDLMAGNRIAAFRIFKIFGFNLTTDGQQPKADRSNWASIEPGGIYGAPGKSPSEAGFDPIDGMSPEAFLKTLNELIQKAASVTDTPLSRFQITGQVAGADTQAEYKEPLYAKVERRQRRLGAMWVDAFQMALKLERLYGDASLSEQADFDVVWTPAKPRSVTELASEAAAKKASGVPEETIWREVWGYSEEQVKTMKAEESYAQRQALVAGALGAQGVRNG